MDKSTEAVWRVNGGFARDELDLDELADMADQDVRIQKFEQEAHSAMGRAALEVPESPQLDRFTQGPGIRTALAELRVRIAKGEEVDWDAPVTGDSPLDSIVEANRLADRPVELDEVKAVYRGVRGDQFTEFRAGQVITALHPESTSADPDIAWEYMTERGRAPMHELRTFLEITKTPDLRGVASEDDWQVVMPAGTRLVCVKVKMRNDHGSVYRHVQMIARGPWFDRQLQERGFVKELGVEGNLRLLLGDGVSVADVRARLKDRYGERVVEHVGIGVHAETIQQDTAREVEIKMRLIEAGWDESVVNAGRSDRRAPIAQGTHSGANQTMHKRNGAVKRAGGELQRDRGQQDHPEVLTDWLSAHWRLGRVLYAKVLSSREAGGFGRIDGGPRLPFSFIGQVYVPAKVDPVGPGVKVALTIQSHGFRKRDVLLEWDRRHAGPTRKPRVRPTSRRGAAKCPWWVRLVALGGETCPLLDEEETGSLMLVSIGRTLVDGAIDCWVWLCRNAQELDEFESHYWEVEPDIPLELW